MRNDTIQKFIKLHRQLTQERDVIQNRLQQINEALGAMPLPSLSPLEGATTIKTAGPSRRRRGASGQSLREHVIAVLQNGPKTKEEVLAAVKQRGYKFSTNNPLNSLGVVLYGKNPSFKRVDGKFALGGGAAGRSGAGQGKAPRAGRRKMSAAGRKAIAEAARKRWAAAKASGKNKL